MITKRFPIEGLHCANCALRAEKVLNKQPGVAAAVCNFAAAEVQVKYDPKATNAEQLAAAIDQAGYRLIITQQNNADAETRQRSAYHTARRNAVIAVLLSVIVTYLSMTDGGACAAGRCGYSPRPWSSLPAGNSFATLCGKLVRARPIWIRS